MSENYGKVWLVGAGPGDAGLLTVKGRKVLDDADVVVFDHLAGKEILSSLDCKKQLINVGKHSGHHPVPQEEINRVLIQEAMKGKKVVRLKGGDPFVFGRGGEELEELVRCRIPFEVIPGVTSALAVPAYAGIPVTHRNCASSVHIITGHNKKGQKEEIPYKALVQTGGTLVFLMGVSALPEIRRGLLQAGMDFDAPAAIIQEGTTAGQRKIKTTVGQLAEAAERSHIAPPAIIVAGPVCNYADILEWYGKLPLQGMRIILTRPREHMGVLAGRLRQDGAEVWEMPAIENVPYADSPRLDSCLEKISQYDWIVFTSQVGVRVFFDHMQERKSDIRMLAKIKFAVIGEGTASALKEKGIFADLIPKVYDGVSLANCLAGQGISGKRILLPRAEKANPDVVPILETAGAVVDEVALYKTNFCRRQAFLPVPELETEKIHCVIFTSSSTVEGFAAAMGNNSFSKIRAVCIGHQTAQTAQRYGMHCFVAEEATVEGLVKEVHNIYEKITLSVRETGREKETGGQKTDVEKTEKIETE